MFAVIYYIILYYLLYLVKGRRF